MTVGEIDHSIDDILGFLLFWVFFSISCSTVSFLDKLNKNVLKRERLVNKFRPVQVLKRNLGLTEVRDSLEHNKIEIK